MTAWPDLPPLPALQPARPIDNPEQRGCEACEAKYPTDMKYETVFTRQQAALPHVIGSVPALRHLPHMTILRVQTGAAAQVINDDSGHWLTYAGTDLADSLDPTDLFFDRHSMDSLVRMLPAVIVDQP